MQPNSEDELWRSIVDNYGDRAELADEPTAAPPPVVAPAPIEEEERFVPPPPPPLPRPDSKRLVAWVGLFGVPTLLLVCLVLGVSLPALAAYAMIAWFVGGFAYLVLLMPRGPREPGDDGARL
ncbi:MAG: hypothetical protein ACR2JD_07900 [Nocardioides sp.]